jgi:peptidoglycan/xylan/chitin deacetylase (PgdA/CDA1 family)
MKRTVLFLLSLALGIAQGASLCVADVSPQDSEPEDYQLLEEIISTEFSGQPPHEWGESVSGVKVRLKTEDKVLAIGVDACDLMGKGEDAKLIKFFEAESIPATLFVCGDWVEKNGAVLRKLAANPLFEIANQGMLRKACSVNGKTVEGAPSTQNIEELFAEIEKNARKIEAVTGILPQYYHSGAGYYDEVAVRIIKALGYEPLGSTIRWPQGQPLDKKQVLDALMNPASGAIAILGGASLQSSFVEGVMESVRKLRSKGYKFVKISDYPLE